MKIHHSRWLLLLTLLLVRGMAPAQLTDTGSLLWKISGNGLKKPSYLYGTIHIQDKRAFQFTPEMEKAFKKSKGFAMELIPDVSSASKLMSMMTLKSGKLSDLFTAEQYAYLEDYFKENCDAPLVLFANYKPFIPYSMVAQGKFKSDMKEALDLHLLKWAKTQKKESITGLETMEEQVSAIMAIPDTTQARMLWEAAIDTTGEDSDTEKFMAMYEKADLRGLEDAMKEEDMGPEFEQGLLITRNHNMADRMVPLMQSRGTFVAVGALHLPGTEGVINLLRAKGYTVEPVISSGKGK